MGTLATRSNRKYPDNAIYEILTMRMKKSEINEPDRYPKSAIKEFKLMLTKVRPCVADTFKIVFEDGMTLADAGKRLGVSSTTVRNRLNEVYTARDINGYFVDKLFSSTRVAEDCVKMVDLSDYLVKTVPFNKHRIVGLVVSAYIEGLSISDISSKYKLDGVTVNSYIDSYNKFLEGDN